MEIYKPEPLIGDPATDFFNNPGQQEHSDTCAIRSQQLIIKEFTGHDPGEDKLIQNAHEHHWYSPGSGTQTPDVGKLLELYGINCHQSTHASIFKLADELAQGHKVIVGVTSDDLWHKTAGTLDPNHFSPADHAIVVSGIDTSDPAHPHVIVTDPGTGQGQSYPMDQFIHAWHGSDFFYVATDEPAPPSAAGMQHFDYQAGHVNHALGVSYDQLHSLADEQFGAVDFGALRQVLETNGFHWVVDLLGHIQHVQDSRDGDHWPTVGTFHDGHSLLSPPDSGGHGHDSGWEHHDNGHSHDVSNHHDAFHTDDFDSDDSHV